jgi:integrase
MRRTKQNGSILRHRGWWVVRYRERVGIGGTIKTVNRAKRLAQVDAQHKTVASVRHLAADILEPVNRTTVSPLTVTKMGDFVERLYLPFAKEQKRPSTYKGYFQIWHQYLKTRCEQSWMKEVKTYDVQTWLGEIARERRKDGEREYSLSKTTLSHVKNFLSGVFRHAAQQGYFNGANPAKLAEIPAFAPEGQEGRAYSLEEIGQMLRVLSEPAAVIVATAAYTGLRLGELRGLTWESYDPAQEDGDSLGLMHVTRSIWRSHVGEPKTVRSKAPVPVIPELAERLNAHRKACHNPCTGPIFANSIGKPLDLDGLYRGHMKDVLTRAEIEWVGWHGFRRGLASNLNRLGIDDSVIQAILRHSDIAVTQRCYIKTTRPEAVEAMRQFSIEVSEVLKRSNCSPLCSPNEGSKAGMRLQ